MQYFDKCVRCATSAWCARSSAWKWSLSANFWTNINDPRIGSFNGVIEQSNLNDNLRQKGLHVIYVPFYLPTDDPRYSATDEALFDEYTAMLKLVQPDFDRSWVKEFHVFRAPHAHRRSS